MRTFLFILMLICTLSPVKAQSTKPAPKFYAETSKKEVLLGNSLLVSFHLENSEGGKFTPPDWQGAGFRLQGTSQSSSFSLVNGTSTSSVTYEYTVAPRDTGALTIPKASLREGDHELQTEFIPIRVLPNPDGTIESPEPDQSYQIPDTPARPEPKKKIKTTRI